MGEGSPFLPALWERVSAWCFLEENGTSSLQGKGLDPDAATVSFVLVSCLHQPPVLVTVDWLLPQMHERASKQMSMSACRGHLMQDWCKGLCCAQGLLICGENRTCSMSRQVPAHKVVRTFLTAVPSLC